MGTKYWKAKDSALGIFDGKVKEVIADLSNFYYGEKTEVIVDGKHYMKPVYDNKEEGLYVRVNGIRLCYDDFDIPVGNEITSSTVYSDSFDEMIQKDFTYKGKHYTWNDSDCLYYNDNGDEDDYFMEIPEGAITSAKKPIKSAKDPYTYAEAMDKVYKYAGKKITNQPIEIIKILDDGKRSGFLTFIFKSGNNTYQMIYDYGFGGEKSGAVIKKVVDGKIESSHKPIKSGYDSQIDELERRAHYALPYDNEITILNRDDKLVIKVALKDDIKRIRGEQAANVIFAKLQGDNKFMQMLDNLVHNDKEVECIVYDPDTNERFASINF